MTLIFLPRDESPSIDFFLNKSSPKFLTYVPNERNISENESFTQIEKQFIQRYGSNFVFFLKIGFLKYPNRN